MSDCIDLAAPTGVHCNLNSGINLSLLLTVKSILTVNDGGLATTGAIFADNAYSVHGNQIEDHLMLAVLISALQD